MSTTFQAEYASTIQGRLNRFFGELNHTWEVSARADRNGVRFLCVLNPNDQSSIDLLADDTRFETAVTWDQLDGSPLGVLEYVWLQVMDDVRAATGIAR